MPIERKLHGDGKPHKEFPGPAHSNKQREHWPQLPDQGENELPDSRRIRQHPEPNRNARPEHGESAEPGYEEFARDSNRGVRSHQYLPRAEHRVRQPNRTQPALYGATPGNRDRPVQFLDQRWASIAFRPSPATASSLTASDSA